LSQPDSLLGYPPALTTTNITRQINRAYECIALQDYSEPVARYPGSRVKIELPR